MEKIFRGHCDFQPKGVCVRVQLRLFGGWKKITSYVVLKTERLGSYVCTGLEIRGVGGTRFFCLMD